ncbi:MAG: hydroxyacid dehydrogenase [Proteobacteria bacterium]|nr:hydroxyacid dehydrogenase [Pseudomonadota bacterium]
MQHSQTKPCWRFFIAYLSTLTLDGTLVFVGLLGELEPTINTIPLLIGRRSVPGSAIGGIAETQEMLDFCGEHNITADSELIHIDEINDAFERLLKSDVKYCFVIDMKTLSA